MDRQQRLIEGFFELVKIYCPTGGEHEVAALLKSKLQELGITDITEDNVSANIGGTANNIFAYLPGTIENADTYPTLLLSAHMDCVPPCENIEPQIIDGIITSKGDTILGGDDKAGVIAILEGLRRIKEDNIPHANIQIIFTVSEEDYLNGSKNMDQSKIKADLGYILDAGGPPGKIINAAPSFKKFTAKITGKAAHAGVAPEAGINAIVTAAYAITKFPQGRLDAETTANVGTITGGNATNIVAEYAEVVCEARSLNPESLEKISAQIVTAFEDAAKEHNAQLDLIVYEGYKSYNINPNDPVILLAKKAIEATGLTVSIGAVGGASDANNFNQYGVPSVPLSIGSTKVHTTDECFSVAHLEQICEIVVSLVTQATK